MANPSGLGMFDRKFILQEGDAPGWLLVYLAGTALAVLVLTLRWFARSQAKAKGSSIGPMGRTLEILAILALLGCGWRLLRMNLTTWIWVSLLMTILAAILILKLLQYERRLVPKAVGNTLLVLRLLVLAVFFLTLLKPALTWELDKSHSGRVLVAVDLSESMETADSHATPGEKLRWARTLGLIGNAENKDRLNEWQKAFDKGEEPKWVAADETDDPDRRKVLAESRQQQLNEIFQQLDQISRKEIARRLLAETSTPLLPALKDVGTLELIVFGGKSESADEEALKGFLEKPPASIQPQVSDLTQGLSPTTANDSNAPLMGVVLLTDGRDNAGRDATRLAARLGNAKAPVFPILIGSEQRPKDLAVAHLDFPQLSFKKDKRILTAVLTTSGFEGEEVIVTLEPAQGEPITKTITPDQTEVAVTFELDEEEIGRHEYTLSVKPKEGETRRDNNSRRFALTIVDDKVRVLLVEGEARWEFRYLTNALYRDEGVGRENVQEVVFHQPYIGIMADTWFPRQLRLPADPNDLANSPFADPDLIVIGDVAQADMPEEAWLLLERFVAESGGTLVLMAGKNDFPLNHRSQALDRLLPMTNLRPINITNNTAAGDPTERGFHLRLTPDGEREAMLQFDTQSRLDNARAWASLPGHVWGLFGEVKPNATVFVTADMGQGGNVTLEDERKNAVIVHQYLGTGQVLWIGIDSTWRWRHRVGDKYHHRFWGQLGRWATRNKASAGNEVVRFGLQRTEIEFGGDAVIQARWTQKFIADNPNIRAKVVISKKTTDEEGKSEFDARPFSTLDLDPTRTGSLLHEARAITPPPGEYKVTLDAPDALKGGEEISTTFYVNEKPTLELSDLSANKKLLQQIADVSDGYLYFPDTVSTLPERLVPPEYRSISREEIELWDNWPILIGFFALLTIEWVVRKLNGLP